MDVMQLQPRRSLFIARYPIGSARRINGVNRVGKEYFLALQYFESRAVNNKSGIIFTEQQMSPKGTRGRKIAYELFIKRKSNFQPTTAG